MFIDSNYTVEGLKNQILTAKDLKTIFHCGINRAYELLKSPCFPSTKMGGRYFVTVSALNEWLKIHEGKTIMF